MDGSKPDLLGANTLADSTRSEDELFDQLSHPLRRRVLYRLSGADSETVFGIDDFVAEKRSAVNERIGLYHNHLPRLAASEYVDWDRQANTITRGARFETIAPTLEVLPGNVFRRMKN